MSNTPIRHKCGYCGWLFGLTTDFTQHQCFKHYIEGVDHINVDENYVVTILSRNSEGARDTLSRDDIDELLISVVAVKRPLYDHRTPASERTLLQKNALWEEVSNCLGGALDRDEAKGRWKYLRDNFIKARKKIRAYVPSGSAANNAIENKSKFKFFDAMRFLEDCLSTRPTTSSLQEVSNLEETEMFDETFECDDGVSLSSVNPIPRKMQAAEDIPQTSVSHRRSSLPPSASTPLTPRSAASRLTISSQAYANGSDVQEQRRPTKKPKGDMTLQAAFVEALKEPTSQPVEPVDGFLLRLGEGMRRLSYRRRARLEIKFLTLLAEAEDHSVVGDV